MRLIANILLLLGLLTGCASQPASQLSMPFPATQVTAAIPTAPISSRQQSSTPTFGVSSASTTPAKATIISPSPNHINPLPEKDLPDSILRSTLQPTVEWKSLPIIPIVGKRPADIYRHGLELGNNPHAFSKVGDCGSTPAWFLGDFDRGPQFYNLGQYTALQEVIQHFQGSFERTSLAGRAGFNTSSVFTALWADPAFCKPGETPLACEYRINRPSFAFIALGANDVFHTDRFEPQMRKIIEFSIEQGVVPILSTKAGNEEGDGSINATLARLSIEYDLPLTNFWLAVQDLPNHGLQEDGVHLTWESNHFDDPFTMKSAWPVRNLTALQTLDAVWRSAAGITR